MEMGGFLNNMDNKMFIEILDDNINFFLRHKDAGENKYTRYSLTHLVKPFTDGGIMQNQDLWRILHLKVFKKTDDGFAQYLPYKLTTGGEWECALQIEGTPDCHGGFHGYEHLTKVTFIADDKEYPLDIEVSFSAKKAVFVQESRIYKQGTVDELIALHTKEYIFENGAVKINQNLEWKQSLSVSRADLCMLPVVRTHNYKPDGILVTDSFEADGDSQVYDVSKEGHKTAYSTDMELHQNVKRVKLWGKESGLVCVVTTDYESLGEDMFFVQNTAPFNKLYFTYVGANGAYQTKVGEKWSYGSCFEIYAK